MSTPSSATIAIGTAGGAFAGAPVDAREAGQFICQLSNFPESSDRTITLRGSEQYHLRRLITKMCNTISSMCLLGSIPILPIGLVARWLAPISRIEDVHDEIHVTS